MYQRHFETHQKSLWDGGTLYNLSDSGLLHHLKQDVMISFLEKINLLVYNFEHCKWSKEKHQMKLYYFQI